MATTMIIAASSASAPRTLLSPTLPPRFRVRRTISTALYGAVLECDHDVADVPPPYAAIRATMPLPRRHRPSVAVKSVSLQRALHASKTSDRKMDDPWQEWHVAAQLIASGGHQNVLQFYQQIHHDDALFFVSEFCSEGDLYEHMATTPTGTVPEREALTLFRQIVLGVQFLHTELQLAHRDLSLENILLRNGMCKVSDFGLSMRASERSTECVGKEYYMAPEVVAEQEYEPCVADIWSLGIMLFILLTGSPLLPVASRAERGFASLASHGVVPVLCAWGVREQLSDACTDLLDQILQVDGAKRIDLTGMLAHPALQRLE